MLRHRSSTTRARLVAGCLAGILAIAACGASESSNGDRDRNVPAGAEAFFSRAIDGVARNKVGDAAIRIPASLTERRQADGSALIAVSTLLLDKQGIRSEIAVSRLTRSGEIDESFGTNGVKTLSVLRTLGRAMSISPDGTIVIVEESEDGKNRLVGMRRYDIASGRPDANFGDNGRIDLSNAGLGENNVLSADAVFADQDGGVILRGTAAFGDMSSKSFLARWTPTGLDTNFGDNGRLLLASASIDGLAIDESITCGAPTLSDGAGAFLAVSGCLRSRNIVSDAGTVTGEFRRAIAFQRFTGAGELDGDAVVSWIDPDDKTYEVGNYPDIVDVDLSEDATKTFVTIDALGSRQILAFADNLRSFVPAGNDLDTRFAQLPKYVSGAGGGATRRLGLARLITTDEPAFVGVSVDSFAEATTIETGAYDLAAMSSVDFGTGRQGVPIGDVPWASRSIEDVRVIGDNVFMNIATTSLAFGPFEQDQQRLNQRGGYLAIGRDGATREPYGSVDGMARSPEQGGSLIAGGLRMPGLFPAKDGSMFSVSHKASFGEENSGTFTITRYSPDAKQKVVSEIVVDGFQPFFWHQPLNAFDGVDNFYIGGFANGHIGVAKLSVTKAGLDTSYGDQGFAELPRDRFGGTDVKWAMAPVGLTLQVDGSVDASVSTWPWAEGDQPRPLTITSTRLTPDGARDETRSEMTLTIPELSLCSCFTDTLALSVRPVIDSDGRLVIAIPDFRVFDDEGNDISPTVSRGGAQFAQVRRLACRAQPCVGGGAFAGAQIRRYTRDGALDPTFGSNGASRVSLYELGVEIPFGASSVAIGPDGSIVVTTIGMEASFPDDAVDEWGIKLEGEYAYSLLLSATGQPLNFTPREQPEAAKTLTDLVNDSRSQFGGGSTATNPLAGGAASPSEAIAAPPGSSVDVVLPPAVIATTGGDRPVITITGTPADRAIDVRWAVPTALAKAKATYTVTASPGGQKCTTSTTSCVFKKLDPWTGYSFVIKTVTAASASVPDSTPSIPVNPVRIVKRGSRTEPTKLISPASTGKATWKATGGCKVTKDGKTFTATKDAALCTLSVTTAKAGKVPKTTRAITVVVRAVAK